MPNRSKVIFAIILMLVVGWIKLVYIIPVFVFLLFSIFLVRKPFFEPTDFWGLVFLKVKPGKVDDVKGWIDKEEGVYNPMIVTGNYDVIATVEASDLDNLMRKIIKLRSIEGVRATHTAINITKFV